MIEDYIKNYPLDLQLYAARKGDLEMAWKLAQYLEVLRQKAIELLLIVGFM